MLGGSHMKLEQLLVTNLSISEDNYQYQAKFSIGTDQFKFDLEISDLETEKVLQDLKDQFSLEEDLGSIKKKVTEMVIEKSSISSKVSEGEHYQESTQKKNLDRSASSLDLA
jgi:hypothetical protein